jgi:hypothetical protein
VAECTGKYQDPTVAPDEMKDLDTVDHADTRCPRQNIRLVRQ